MNEEEIQFESYGQQLFGVFTEADGGGDALVIMIHGGPGGDHNGPSNIFIKTAHALAREGIASLRFDFRGSGDSEGDFVDTTIQGEVDDLATALHLALTNGYTRIGLLGESMGGTVALLASDARYKALVLWYPAIDLMDTSLQQYFTEEHSEELSYDGYVTDGDIRIGRPFLDEVKTLSLQPILPTISQPVLFIHGDQDDDVPHSHSLNAAKLLRTECHVEIIAGGGHCLRRPREQKRAIKLTVQWFVKHLA